LEKNDSPSGNNQKPHQHLINDEKKHREKKSVYRAFHNQPFVGIDKKDKTKHEKVPRGGGEKKV
jgi:hypothetical protein